MKLVFDATTLIYFSRMGILNKVAQLNAEKIVPSEVYYEVVEKGKKKGKTDATFLEKLVSERIFLIGLPKPEEVEYFRKFSRVRKADAETLALAKSENAIAVIDESNLRTIAGAHGIKYGGPIFILFELYRKKSIVKSDIRKHMDEMISLGWRCSTELYASILRKIEEL